ncbi:serine hydrolase [Legionella waltersii]|nr:serine hydrolase [Legionella waltersii]
MMKNWLRGIVTSLIIAGAIMDPLSAYAGKGRGDIHVTYFGKSVDDLIIEYMERNNVPGMLLAIVQAPYITRVVGYGLADTDKKLLVSTRTVFNLGQLTTAYTAVAIMQLKEEGKLNLDDPINTFLDKVPSAWKPITIRNLLTQTSGIADYTTISQFEFTKKYQPDEIIQLIADKPLLFNPGSQMQSSGTNFYLLGLIIEKASGMSYQSYVTQNQIVRLGLQHTYFIANSNSIPNEVNQTTTPFKHSKFLDNPVMIDPVELAQGYEQNGDSLTASPSASWDATYANSGIIASAEDVSLWDIGLAGNILVKDPQDRAFLYSSVLMNGLTIPGNAGWRFPGHKGLMEIKGNIPGYSSFLSRFTDPNELLCVTLLANKGNLPDLDILGRKIAAAFDNKLGAPAGASWSETIQSPYSVQETIQRVMTIIKKNGGTIFAHINHSEEAKKANQVLLDTEVIIVGNPAKGTVLMQKNPAFALDLPLRIMATKDAQGQVWLSFTDPVKLGKEYDLNAADVPALGQISQGMKKVCEAAVSSQTQF